MQFDEVLQAFTTFFERERIRYAVIGGLAVHAWGGSRLTRDVDLVAERADQARIITFAESLGYETLQSTEAFSNHVHSDPKMGRVDLLYVNRETADKLFPAATTKVVVGDVEAPVASPEHIAMMKALAMKNFPHRALFEGEDVRILLDVPGIDREAVRDYFERQGLLGIYDAIEKVEPLDELAGDLALTRDENEQLWRVRRLNRMSAREYLDFLVAFTEGVPPSREVSPEPEELFEL